MNNPFTLIDSRLENIENLLLELNSKQQSASTHQPGKLLTISEAAEFVNLAKPTLYRLVHLRQIPFSKPKGSKRLYFKREDLAAWIQTGRKRTVAEIQEQAADFVKMPTKNAKG